MKKLALTTLLALALAPAVFADKLEGKATCAKCDLQIAKACQAAVVVTDKDGKAVTYLATANDKATTLQEEVCGGGKAATVEGAVTEKDGKKQITITSYTFK